jgi:hypothetical protein
LPGSYFAANLMSGSSRRHVHTRSICVDVFVREDGLWDIEAELVDLKAKDFKLATGVRRIGDPLHEMKLAVTIDAKLTIRDAKATMTWTPYSPYCTAAAPDYSQLIGLNFGQDYRRHVRERLGGVHGCSHLTELAQVLPSVAVQGFANEIYFTRDAADVEPDSDQRKPFQIDRCHALKSSAEAVAQYYPRWYRASGQYTKA